MLGLATLQNKNFEVVYEAVEIALILDTVSLFTVLLLFYLKLRVRQPCRLTAK